MRQTDSHCDASGGMSWPARAKQAKATTCWINECGHVIAHRSVTVNEAPPNKWMQLTVKSVTPFAKREEQRERHFRPQLIPGVRRHYRFSQLKGAWFTLLG